MQQEVITINKKTLEEKTLLAYKYMLTDTGVVFVINTESLPKPEKTINIAKGDNSVFLQSGEIYALLTDTIVDHFKKVMGKTSEIVISFVQSLKEEYEIRTGFSVVLDPVNCATLVSLYRIVE